MDTLLSGYALGAFCGGIYIVVACIMDGDFGHIIFGLLLSVVGYLLGTTVESSLFNQCVLLIRKWIKALGDEG